MSVFLQTGLGKPAGLTHSFQMEDPEWQVSCTPPLMMPAPLDYQSHPVTQLPWGICGNPVSIQEMKKWRLRETKKLQAGSG